VTTLERYGASDAQLAALLSELGEPAYRARQLSDGLWRQRTPLEALHVLPRELRGQLAELLPLALAEQVVSDDDRGATRKWLWSAHDGAQIETVLMRYRERATVCVSSQAGCAMGCSFCATGQAGFDRQLRYGEICEQVVRAQHATEARVGNVVYMGMGEPLANVDEVLASLTDLHDRFELSARHLTVSTVGVIPGMQRLREFTLPVTLAVSVHAADDRLRDELVPLNRRYPLADVLDEARAYAATKGRRVTFEYACIAGVNDHPHQADALADRLTGFRGGAHVNLIPLNPTAGYPGRPADADRIRRFAARLESRGVRATIRRNRGTRIDAACGQLRFRAGAPSDRTSLDRSRSAATVTNERV
jgi:23S rRNA (adenine2503-C2)-methyltransferase